MTLADDQDAVHTHTILLHRVLNCMRAVKHLLEALLRYKALHGVLPRDPFRDGGDGARRTRALLCIHFSKELKLQSLLFNGSLC